MDIVFSPRYDFQSLWSAPRVRNTFDYEAGSVKAATTKRRELIELGDRLLNLDEAQQLVSALYDRFLVGQCRSSPGSIWELRRTQVRPLTDSGTIIAKADPYAGTIAVHPGFATAHIMAHEFAHIVHCARAPFTDWHDESFAAVLDEVAVAAMEILGPSREAEGNESHER